MNSCSHSVWKPLRGPLRDWPLALCDAASVQANDLTPADVVFDTKVTENMQVHHDAAQKWYYLEDQDPSELLVFRQADSHHTGRVGKFTSSGLSLPVSMVPCSSSLKVCLTHRSQIPRQVRMSCRGKALKFGQSFLTAMSTKSSFGRSRGGRQIGVEYSNRQHKCFSAILLL